MKITYKMTPRGFAQMSGGKDGRYRVTFPVCVSVSRMSHRMLGY